MYELTLDRGYTLTKVKCDDIDEAFDYGKKFLRDEVKDPEKKPLRIIINESQEKRAEGDDPEPAREVNQL